MALRRRILGAFVLPGSKRGAGGNLEWKPADRFAKGFYFVWAGSKRASLASRIDIKYVSQYWG